MTNQRECNVNLLGSKTSIPKKTQRICIKVNRTLIVSSARSLNNLSKLKKSYGPGTKPLALSISSDSNHTDNVEHQSSATPQMTAVRKSSSDVTKPSSIAIRLLSDLNAVFEEKGASKFKTRRLIIALCKSKPNPWATYSRRGQYIGARQLAARLKEFEIHSKDIRFRHGVAKGYRREWFVEALQRINDTNAT